MLKVFSEEFHKRGLTLEKLTLGQTYQESFVITAEMIESFAQVTQEHNPIHLDEDYAKGTIFGARVAQGMLPASLLSGILGTHFPGIGSIYLSQTLKFLKPIFIGDEITIRLKVLEIVSKKNRVRLKTAFTNQNGEPVINGEAVVMPPSQ